jgi:hypothetical protein
VRTSRVAAGRGSGERPRIVTVLRWWFRVPVRRRERSWAPAAISLLGLAAAIIAARVTQIPSNRPPAEVPLVIVTGDSSSNTLPLPSDLPLGTPTGPTPTPTGPTPTTPTPTPSSPPTTAPTSSTATRAAVVSTVTPSRSSTGSPRRASPSTGTAPCKVAYTFGSNWGSGFVASITITNTSGRAWSGWSGGFGMSTAASVTSSWGASLQASGGWVSFVPADYNASVAAGSGVQIGFQAVTTAQVKQLGPFSVNGNTCSAG